MKSVRIAVKEKVSCVIGTSGLTPNELEKLAALTKENQTPVFVAPNFALGAVLMMRFAKEAARYFPNVEIIERHHDQKLGCTFRYCSGYSGDDCGGKRSIQSGSK